MTAGLVTVASYDVPLAGVVAGILAVVALGTRRAGFPGITVGRDRCRRWRPPPSLWWSTGFALPSDWLTADQSPQPRCWSAPCS